MENLNDSNVNETPVNNSQPYPWQKPSAEAPTQSFDANNPNVGAPIPQPTYREYNQPAPTPEPQRQRVNITGIIGFVCSLVGLTFCWWPIYGFCHSLAGVIVCAIAMRHPQKSLASVGLVISIIALVASIIITVVLIPPHEW